MRGVAGQTSFFIVYLGPSKTQCALQWYVLGGVNNRVSLFKIFSISSIQQIFHSYFYNCEDQMDHVEILMYYAFLLSKHKNVA